ncbi:hypothetical protein [Phenylobacterium montanum]|uniref:Uncharacterized protein n=1 Tax=Phenylobacterium montanum TaxID=2823693 RepID=A0A975FVV6_9CAUL|nr:hypothetical protein [Caulobacter sp. S6]QUD86239.1 hypothetical protein KCG34_14145 [Caulobacter sp. S6]
MRRNGDANQRGITKADLKPYVDMVERRIVQNADSPVWEKMDARWAALVRDARSRIANYEGGFASPRQNVQAAREIVTLAGEVDPRRVVVAVSAMFMMLTAEPHRFKSDRAFDVQLVRRVRGLAAANSTSYIDPKTGRTRRTYHELPPRAATVMSDWLRETLGVLGHRLARLEEEERRLRDEERAELNDALMALR